MKLKSLILAFAIALPSFHAQAIPYIVFRDSAPIVVPPYSYASDSIFIRMSSDLIAGSSAAQAPAVFAQAAVVPEPTTGILMLAGLVLMLARRTIWGAT